MSEVMPGSSPAGFLSISSDVSLKILEKPYLYNRRTDELYALDADAFCALSAMDGTTGAEDMSIDGDFLAYCMEEGLLSAAGEPRYRQPSISGPSPVPSLRYLEVQVTRRCNLACRHCYLGEARAQDMAPGDFAAIAGEFASIGGLRLMVSGGEPLCHPEWAGINAALDRSDIRRVLLTNGSLLDRSVLEVMNFDEVQVSIDGMRAGHDFLRGAGSFEKALKAARLVAESGIALSIATQAHKGNMGEFDELAGLVEELSAIEWGIDAPCIAGRLTANPALAVSVTDAARAMSYATGGAYHGGGEGEACGLHLMTVGADGTTAQCGFYFDKPLGMASEGLGVCWARRNRIMLAEIKACAGCEAAMECGGGCRFRAGDLLAPDPVMCAAMGVSSGPSGASR